MELDADGLQMADGPQMADGTRISGGTRMEVAYILYLDMVGYSRLSLETQAYVALDLRELVRATAEFARHETEGDLLRLDTGDGMALVFFADPQSPIRCACEIAAALGRPPRLPLRIGLHCGPIIRTRDINGGENVSGDGINRAQRVMGCGDAGHILLSRHYADLLIGLALWAPDLHDLGEATVKHGERLHLVSFHCAHSGSPAPPQSLRLPAKLEATAPTNLPFWRTDQFVGRAPTLARVHDLLQAAAPVALVGLSGMGKTHLALQYAHLHRQDYPSGVFWLNAADNSHLKTDFAALGRSFFGIPEDLSTEICVLRLRDRLHHLTEPALLVLDNVTEETDLSLLPSSAQCRLLLTAQQKHLFPTAFETVELAKFEPEAALTLLGASVSGLDRDELAAARQIADDVGRLPLALDLLAQYRTRLHRSFADLRRRLEEQKLLNVLERAREKFVTATGHKGNIYESIQGPYLGLHPSAQTVLAVAACFAPADLGRELLLVVLGPAEADDSWEEALADLVDASLISEEETTAEPGAPPVFSLLPRLRLHELVRLFARIQLSEDERRTYITRLAAALTDRLQQANENLDWRGIRPETTHLIYTASECRVLEVREDLYPLLIARGRFFIMHRDFSGAEAVLREALALTESLHGPMHRSRASALRLLGEVAQMQGDHRNALRAAWSAFRIARRAYSQDDPERHVYYSTLGFILKDQGQFHRARPFYLGMIAFTRRVLGPMHTDVSKGLNNLGMLCAQQGNLDEAETHLREALAIELANEQAQSSPTGSTSSMAIYWNSLGRILGQQERWAEALDCHQAALEINERIHGANHPDYATSLYYSAVAAHALRRWLRAETQYRDVLHLCQRLFGEDNVRCGQVQEKLRQLAEDSAETLA